VVETLSKGEHALEMMGSWQLTADLYSEHMYLSVTPEFVFYTLYYY
jgi:hypothetical protein